MKIEILCPELCCLYGDMGNADYLRASLGGSAEFISTGLSDSPAFASTDVDLIYLGSMTERSQERVIEKLMPLRERLGEIISSGTLLLATGNAHEIFMDRIEAEDGSVLKGLGLVPYHAKRKLRERYNSLYLGRFEDAGLDIVGYTSRFTYTYGIPEGEGLFSNIKGTGSEPGSGTEGYRRGGLMGTDLLGPLLVLNPDFTRYILRTIGAEDAEPAFYEDARRAYDVRLAEFRSNIDFGTHC